MNNKHRSLGGGQHHSNKLIALFTIITTLIFSTVQASAIVNIEELNGRTFRVHHSAENNPNDFTYVGRHYYDSDSNTFRDRDTGDVLRLFYTNAIVNDIQGTDESYVTLYNIRDLTDEMATVYPSGASYEERKNIGYAAEIANQACKRSGYVIQQFGESNSGVLYKIDKIDGSVGRFRLYCTYFYGLPTNSSTVTHKIKYQAGTFVKEQNALSKEIVSLYDASTLLNTTYKGYTFSGWKTTSADVVIS